MLSLVFLASAAPSLPLRPPLLATPSLPLRARALAAGPLPLRVPPPRMTASPPSDSRSSESAALYSKMERLLRAPKAKASPLVRSLTRNWLTLPPEELVENALVIGRSLFDTFDDGFELLEAAEHVAGGALSARAYGGLMRIGEAEGRHADVLALLGRMRACGAPPGPAVMLAAMHAAASLGDWGCVSRLFSEYAGDDGAAAPLEVLGEPAAVEELEEALRGCSPLAPGAALTRYDTEAIRLAVRAHCARGDGALAEATLARARELALPLDLPAYAAVGRLARARRSLAPLGYLRPADILLSAGGAVEPSVLEARAALSRLSRADRDLLAAGVCAAALAAAAVVASGGSSAELDGFSNALTGFDHLDAL